MTILNTEIVSKNSPAWIGLQHFLLSGLIFLFIAPSLQIIGLPFGNFFGFFFATLWQELMLTIVAGFFAILVSTRILRNKISAINDTDGVVMASLAYFILLNILILSSLYSGDQAPHYGVTGKDIFDQQMFLSFVQVAVYYSSTKMFLKVKKES